MIVKGSLVFWFYLLTQHLDPMLVNEGKRRFWCKLIGMSCIVTEILPGNCHMKVNIVKPNFSHIKLIKVYWWSKILGIIENKQWPMLIDIVNAAWCITLWIMWFSHSQHPFLRRSEHWSPDLAILQNWWQVCETTLITVMSLIQSKFSCSDLPNFSGELRQL